MQGDSHHARCLKSPYSVLQLPHEVHIELPLPFWVLPEEDLEVTINDMGVTVVVDGVMQLQRQYWRAGSQDAKVSQSENDVVLLPSLLSGLAIGLVTAKILPF